MENIKVLIVEDMDSLRNKYKRIIDNAEGIDVVGCASNGYEGVLLAAVHKPDIILMDIEMETKDAGLIASRQIVKQMPNCKIIILTVHQNDMLIYAAFEEGVSNYILKNLSAAEIINCIKNTYKNAITLRGEISNKVLKEFQRMREKEKIFQKVLTITMQLTASQLHILYLLWIGKTREEICDMRCIEPTSLKTHIHNILTKLELKNVNELVSLVDKIRLFDYVTEFIQKYDDSV